MYGVLIHTYILYAHTYIIPRYLLTCTYIICSKVHTYLHVYILCIQDADTPSSHVMDQPQNMDVSHVADQPQNMDVPSSHVVDQPQNMDLPSSDGEDQLERINLPSLDDVNVVTSRKRTRRSTFDVPQTLSKSSHIVLPEVSSGEGVGKKSRDPESAPPSKKMRHGAQEVDQDTSNIEKVRVC